MVWYEKLPGKSSLVQWGLYGQRIQETMNNVAKKTWIENFRE